MNNASLVWLRLRLTATLLLAHVSVQAAQPNIALPPGERWNWGKEPVETIGSARGEMVLNGLWLFQPASAGSSNLPTGQWAAIRVPGSWDTQDTWDKMPLPGLVGQPPAWPDATFRTQKNPDCLYLAHTSRAWYEREITVPKEWAGRKILLTFERVSTDAEIFINDSPAGAIHWPGGDLDITARVPAGATATLRVRVTAVASERELVRAMREDYVERDDGGLRQRGIIGDVRLISRPTGAHLDALAIETSVTRHELSVSTEAVELKTPVRARFTATVTEWPGGNTAKTFASETEMVPGKPVVLKWPWAEAKLWDIGQPNLYTLNLKVEVAELQDEVAERFGFRELRIEGRNFRLNGTPFFGRMTHAGADRIGGIKEAADAETRRNLAQGYNLLEIWPNDTFRRGTADFRAAYARSADEAGILLLMPLIRTDDLFNWRTAPAESVHQDWLHANRHYIQQVRNCPSVAGYLFSGNEFMTSDDQNPLRLGRREALAQSQQQNVSPGLALIEELRALDPTRFITSHANANVGDIHTGNHYLGLTPLQEREETLAYWAKNGDLPYGAVEFCSPFSTDLNRARKDWNTASEPLATEFMAGLLGGRAYAAETPAYRNSLREHFDEAQGRFTGGAGYTSYPPYRDYQLPQIQKLWRSWRTYGVSLGMIQWEKILETTAAPGTADLPPFQPGRRGCYFPSLAKQTLQAAAPDPQKLDALEAVYLQSIQPLMAYLGGPLDEADGWVAKDHLFTAGQRVRKSVVLLNDGRIPQPFTVEWRALDADGNTVSTKTNLGNLGVGQKAFLPVEFDARFVQEKSVLTLKIIARLGTAEKPVTLTDETPVRILPALPAPEQKPSVFIFDPEGRTTALLRRVGFAPEPWHGDAMPAGAVLVIGRRAMSGADFDATAFRRAVERGGHAVLFAQDPQLLRDRGGLRLHQWVGRQFWPVETEKNHPLLAGLDEEDFRDWAGAGTLLPSRNEENLAENALRRGYPIYGYRVSTRGSVSSAAWEKPQRSGWTPLLEGEFDMAYSPLLELHYGEGYLLSCSLDLEDRQDPMVDLMARRVIQAAASAEASPRRKVFYTGNQATETWLKASGLIFSRLVGSPPNGSLLVVGPATDLRDAQFRPMLSAGTQILLLGQTGEKLPMGLTAQKSVYGLISQNPLPAWPELRGVSASELRLRTDLEMPLVQAAANVELAAQGLLARSTEAGGVLLAFQGSPLLLDAGHKFYFRFSEWRWTRALSQILANMGATFSGDDRLFELTSDPFVPLELAGNWKVLAEYTLPAAPSASQPTVDPGPKTLAPSKTEFDDAAWPTVRLPAMDKIGDIDWRTSNGSLWARRKIFIPADWKGHGDLNLVLGVMDDHDVTYFNGNPVGATGAENPQAWNTERNYRVPAGLVNAEAENTIAIRLFNQFGGGGFGAAGTPLAMRLELGHPPEQPSVYVPGFRTDKEMGDDPARYTRW